MTVPKPKPIIVKAYNKLEVPLSRPNSFSISGIKTTTDHIPTVPSRARINNIVALNHAPLESETIKLDLTELISEFIYIK